MKLTSIIILITALIGGYFLIKRPNTAKVTVPEEQNTKIEIVESEKILGNSGSPTVFNNGYRDYDKSEILQPDGKIVLFFHAKWCPYCRGLDNALKNDLSKIPSDLLILKTDFDSSKELKQKYGVTLQHTLVQIDEAGNLINKWSGSENLDQILVNLK